MSLTLSNADASKLLSLILNVTRALTNASTLCQDLKSGVSVTSERLDLCIFQCLDTYEELRDVLSKISDQVLRSGSSSGRTSDFESDNLGSIPSPETKP